jgi:putative PIN family toxin of toxin-antitoxin system
MSRPIQAEYRRVLESPEILRRNPQIKRESIELVLRRLRYVGQYLGHITTHFRFERDPDDEPFIELAIEAGASHIVTADNDLLALTHGHDDAAKRLRQRAPRIRIMRAVEFLRELERSDTA